MEHEVLAAVLQVRREQPEKAASLHVLLWQRAMSPERGKWALPGGGLGAAEDVHTSVGRQLAEKVDVRELAHAEQLAVFSEPERVGVPRVIASAFLGLVPSGADPSLPADTAWQPLDDLPPTAFDHHSIVIGARARLRAKLSYTNLGFALAPREFTISTLREIYSAALDHPVSATNLQRVLTRRGLLESTGRTAPPGRGGGRPAAVFRFAGTGLRVTDPFAVLRPPE